VSGWSSVRLGDVSPGDGWAPLRAQLGIEAFGINGWRGAEAGATVIGDHTETTTGHEELYLVLEGHATFTVAGDEIDAPAGTLVFVGEPSARRGAVAKDANTAVLAIGARPGERFRVSEWEQAQMLYREKRYAEAVELLRAQLAEFPDRAGVNYNLACFESLAGEPAATVATHLARAIELDPSLADAAASDSDFDPVRETEEYRSAVAGKPEPGRTGA
jgi:hypothetical protein